jgi:hypothetical protein
VFDKLFEIILSLQFYGAQQIVEKGFGVSEVVKMLEKEFRNFNIPNKKESA